MNRGCRVAVLLLGLAVPAPAQSVLLNEIQVSNQTTIADENADTPDWIELFNPGPASVDLNGWGLSDSTNALFKWTFTNASLAPGSFLLVFASGKDRQPGQFGAVNPATVPGLRAWLRADAVNTADATQVRTSAGGFHVRSWRDQSGAAFHAGQGTDANQPRFIPAVPELGGRPALRFDGTNDLLYLPASPAANNFTIIAVARPTAGHEIDPQGAAGVGGVSGQRYLFGAQHGGDFNGGSGLSLGTNGASIYEHGSGYMPALAVLATPIASLAIVTVNYSNKQPTLTVNGTLSSPGAESPRATVTAPVELGAGAYGAFAGDVAEILIFDRTLTEAEARGIEESLRMQYGLAFPAAIRHTNFTLDKDGEKVFLTRPDGTLADWLPSVEIPRDLSWGRQPDGSTNLFFFATPTPGTNNSTPGATDFLKMPKFSVGPGFYTTNVALELINTNLLPGAVIRYTRDGSEPTTNSPLYTAPIVLGPRAGTPNDISMIPTAGGWQPPLGEVFKLHVIRTRAFRTNSIPSGVNTASYCIDPRGRARFSLPIVSLSSDRANFFDANTGIYVCGNTPGCNYAQSGDLWERPCHVEFFETNGLRVLDQKSGVRMHGNTSFGFPVKGLRLHPLNQQGTGPFEYRIFPDLNVDKFYRLLLRPSGHDNYLTMMRDGLMQNLMRETGIDMQGYRPAILFINGEYWGVHNLQEAFDEHYFETHYPASVDKDAVDYIEGYAPGAAPQNGDATHFHNLIAFMTTNNLALAANYAWVRTQMEVDNYIDYKASETFYCRWDIGNHRLWRPHTDTGRWRWIIFDQDVGYGGFWQQPTAAPWTFNMLAYNLESAGPWTNYQPGNDHNHPTLTFQLRALLTNPDFKRSFINRFADLMNGTLSVERMTNVIARMAAEISPEMAEHCRRWRAPADWPTWTNNVAWLHRFATNRATYARQQLTNQFGLRGMVMVTLRVNDTNAGTIRWNTLALAPPTNAPWSGTYFRDNAVTFSAQAFNGYRFKNWTGLAGPPATNATNTLTLSGNLALTANFEALPATNSPLPLAHDLAAGPYVWTDWSTNAAGGAYPPNMLFLQTPANAAPDPALAVEFTNWWTLPYDRASRSRINALGDDGIAFLNTSDPQADGGGYLGAAVLALNTTGRTNVQVAWRGGTVTPNSRPYAIRLQYRVGASNAFADMLDATGQPVEYPRSGVAGHSAALGPATLPPECDDQPYVQLRWKYYSLGGTSGSRDQLRLDNIVVADRISPPGDGRITARQDGRFLIQFEGMLNFPYTLETSTNLVDWLVAGTTSSEATGMIEFTAAATTNGPTRFFRVRWP
jgi:hypothetical protein